MRKILPLLLSVFILVLGSCKRPQAFIYKDLRNLKIDNLGLAKSRVSVNFIFFNPNNYGVNLKKVDCDLYVDSNYVGKFLLDTTMHIPKSAEFALPASFDVEMKNILKNTVNVLFGNEVLVSARGTTRVGKGGIYVTIPFEYEGRQKLNVF